MPDPNNSSQPFRDEVNRIANHYIAHSSPRELNLSHRDRLSLLTSLRITTHPSAFAHVASLIESTLRNQLHPNFVRWTICNGNRPKVVFVRGMGTLFTTIAVTLTIVLTLSHVSRWWRVFVFLPFFMGITTLTSAYKGLCIVFHHSGNIRSIHPWEVPDRSAIVTPAPKDEEEGGVCDAGAAAAAAGDGMRLTHAAAPPTAHTRRDAVGAETDSEPDGSVRDSASVHTQTAKSKWLDTFGSRNEFSQERWVQRWRQRPFIRRIMEPTTKVQEEGVRIMQNKIVQQSQLWGLVGASILTICITALPKGNYF